jgi:hypothetical protein
MTTAQRSLLALAKPRSWRTCAAGGPGGAVRDGAGAGRLRSAGREQCGAVRQGGHRFGLKNCAEDKRRCAVKDAVKDGAAKSACLG